MAHGPITTNGLLDLERELTCSICTDILYQPLTVLDCLHTFCGSCLKEWFGCQAVRQQQDDHRNQRRNIIYTFTCPSCRATVRETRPNATVTTLLDMWMQANPSRVKSKEEKEEIHKIYQPGERVLPAPSSQQGLDRSRDSDISGVDEAEDERLLEQVREMSLWELSSGIRRPLTERNPPSRAERNIRYDRPRQHGGHGADGTRDIEARTESLTPQASVSSRVEGTMNHSRGAYRDSHDTRQVEHQSSLRSLLSVSDVDSQELQEDIMRQILEDGLLDGIDLNHIEASQEDEISERIAQAYRRSRARRRDGNVRDLSSETPANHARASRPGRSPPREAENIEPAVARVQGTVELTPALRSHVVRQDVNNTHAQRRPSSQASGRLRPHLDGEVSRSATNSPADLSQTMTSIRTSKERSRHLAPSDRRSPVPEPLRISEQWRRGTPSALTAQTPPIASDHIDINSSTAALAISGHPATSDPSFSHASPGPPSASASILKPTVHCARCSRANIEHELHYACHKCPVPVSSSSELYALCKRCYRLNKGCLEWCGFGNTTWLDYKKRTTIGGYTAREGWPHALNPQRYVTTAATDADSEDRLERGLFCSVCCRNTNACYWQCDSCNDGEWGYCNLCVNQGRHCIHSLLPLTYDESKHASSDVHDISTEYLPVDTSCNICNSQIPSAHDRFHCPTCNGGDYDICFTCYRSLASNGRITERNGEKGWRRCLEGHRMLVIGSEDGEEGSRRLVVEDVIGGWSWPGADDQDAIAAPNMLPSGVAAAPEQKRNVPQNFTYRDGPDGTYTTVRRSTSPFDSSMPGNGDAGIPPRGGSGLRMLALWGRLPDEGMDDELDFPKGAVITEVFDINGDWCWGTYCRRGGLFPGNYGRLIR